MKRYTHNTQRSALVFFSHSAGWQSNLYAILCEKAQPPVSLCVCAHICTIIAMTLNFIHGTFKWLSGNKYHNNLQLQSISLSVHFINDNITESTYTIRCKSLKLRDLSYFTIEKTYEQIQLWFNSIFKPFTTCAVHRSYIIKYIPHSYHEFIAS